MHSPGIRHCAAGRSNLRQRAPIEPEFCTVARWEDGEIVEEKLFYD
jgi:hypothetical protein